VAQVATAEQRVDLGLRTFSSSATMARERKQAGMRRG
jgi:hypothetical protein